MYAFYGGTRRSLNTDDTNGISSIYGGQSVKATLIDTSITSPSFHTFNNRGFIAWTGTDSNHRLNVMCTDNLRVWYGKVVLGDTSLSGPALAVFNKRLTAASERSSSGLSRSGASPEGSSVRGAAAGAARLGTALDLVCGARLIGSRLLGGL